MADTIRHSQNYRPTALLRPASWRRIAWPYGVTVLVIATGFALKLFFAAALRGEASYVLFVPAVLIGSALGGWGPGLLATALGLALGLIFVADARQFAAADVVNGVIPNSRSAAKLNRSNPGGGTIFAFTLPLVDKEEDGDGL
jgi:O-antigen ligase